MDVHYELGGESFVWNDAKAEANWHKHGVRFEEAAQVFFDPLLVLTDASRNDEEREAVIGFDASARLLFVVHVVFEDAYIRIISARRAEPQEEARYAE